MTKTEHLESVSVCQEVLDAAVAFAKKELSHVDASHDWSYDSPVNFFHKR